MAKQSKLSIQTFLAASEMIAAHLRIKEADRWSAQISQLKYVSFTQAYPEVSQEQFLWAAEQFVQTTTNKDFLRYPTWDELMTFLYRLENGKPNRSWGFKENLPQMCQPVPNQLALMPPKPASNYEPPDKENKQAYKTFKANRALKGES